MQAKLTEIWEAYKQEQNIDKKIVYYFCYYILGGKRECDKKLKECESWRYSKAYFTTFMLLRRYLYTDCADLHILSELIRNFGENGIYFDEEYSFDLVSEIVLNTIDRESVCTIHKDNRWYEDLNAFFKHIYKDSGQFNFVDKTIREFGLLKTD